MRLPVFLKKSSTRMRLPVLLRTSRMKKELPVLLKTSRMKKKLPAPRKKNSTKKEPLRKLLMVLNPASVIRNPGLPHLTRPAIRTMRNLRHTSNRSFVKTKSIRPVREDRCISVTTAMRPRPISTVSARRKMRDTAQSLRIRDSVMSRSPRMLI